MRKRKQLQRSDSEGVDMDEVDDESSISSGPLERRRRLRGPAVFRPAQTLLPLPELDMHAYLLLVAEQGGPGLLGPDFDRAMTIKSDLSKREQAVRDYYARQARIISVLLAQVSTTQNKDMKTLLSNLYLTQWKQVDIRPDFSELALYYIHHDNLAAISALMNVPRDLEVDSVRQTFNSDRMYVLAEVAGRYASWPVMRVLLEVSEKYTDPARHVVTQMFKVLIAGAWSALRSSFVTSTILPAWRQWPNEAYVWQHGDSEAYRIALKAVQATHNVELFRDLQGQNFLPPINDLNGFPVDAFILHCYLTDINSNQVKKRLSGVWTHLTDVDKVTTLESHFDIWVRIFSTIAWYPRDCLEFFAKHIVLDQQTIPLMKRLVPILLPGIDCFAGRRKFWGCWALKNAALHLLPAHGIELTTEVVTTIRGGLGVDMRKPKAIPADDVLDELRLFEKFHVTWNLTKGPEYRMTTELTVAQWTAFKALYAQPIPGLLLVKWLSKMTEKTHEHIAVEWFDLLHAHGAGDVVFMETLLKIMIGAYAANIPEEIIERFVTDVPRRQELIDEFYSNPDQLVETFTNRLPRRATGILFRVVRPTQERMSLWSAAARRAVDEMNGPRERAAAIYFVKLLRQYYPDYDDNMDTSSTDRRVPQESKRR